MIFLTHQDVNLWVESGILTKLHKKNGQLKSLKEILEEARKWADKSSSSPDEYKHKFGMLGEVFAEFYFKRLGHIYGLFNITDTSSDQFFRGHDFLAQDVSKIPARIQVKMRRDSEHLFTESDLFTFFNEADKIGIHKKRLFLFCPTSSKTQKDVLHWKNNFQKEKKFSFEFIGRVDAQDVIRKHVISSTNEMCGEYLQFMQEFRQSVQISVHDLDYVI